MRPISRHGVNKGHSARQFKSQVSRTKQLNVRTMPMRGGIRL